ncbi:MAG: SUMF1/EgtB/PvdO family nonheme iron enzyme [Alphaproteobacteria bacterium]|nr:SUMF1/EgtB/PvdO family nonheme iron enzyme [Alphaproteobacteria bacterium]
MRVPAVLLALSLIAVLAVHARASSEPTTDGAVLIYANAAGAAVLVDGKRRGEMPARTDSGFRVLLPAGNHTIELKRDGRNVFYEFRASASVSVQPDTLLPIAMPALEPSLLPDARSRVDKIVASFLPQMATIPQGTYQMGGREEEDSSDNEFPRHEVVLAKPFLMQKYNVTFEQWDACVADQGCTHIPNDENRGRGAVHVFNVNWQEARDFAAWISRRLDRTCRLPSEAEWEYAVRGGSQAKFFWGDGTQQMSDYVSMGIDHPSSVPPKMPNPFGLFAMVGGMTEWVADCWHSTYAGAPTDGSVWGAPSCTARVVRGGFWDADPWYWRSARRSTMIARNRYNYVGFRLSCASKE